MTALSSQTTASLSLSTVRWFCLSFNSLCDPVLFFLCLPHTIIRRYFCMCSSLLALFLLFNSIFVAFTAAAAVSAFYPTVGTTAGGTSVTLVGSSFAPLADLVCRFGTAVVFATWSSSSLVECSSPAVGAGGVSLSVSNGNLDFSTAADQFVYANLPTASSLSITHGPQCAFVCLTRSSYSLFDLVLTVFFYQQPVVQVLLSRAADL